ncbi:MAG: copper resistance protein CopC, partial [Mesorhizobium sp.]
MNTMFLLQKTVMAGRRVGWAAGMLLAMIMALVVMASTNQAFAHAALIKADPPDGSVLAQAPAQFALTFSEPVSPLVLTLVKPDGTPVALTSFRLSDQTLEIDDPQPLKSGTHVLSWRVISADGHPVGGSLLFSIGAPSAPPAVSEAVDWQQRAAIWIGKVLLYVGLFLGVGGAFALAWLAGGGRAGQRLVTVAILCGLVATPLSLGFQGLDALGAPLSHLAQPVIWRTALGTSFGSTVLIALVALGLGLLSLAGPRAAARPLALAGLAGVGAALAASGHASAAEPQWLTGPIVFLHGAGIAFWAGALAPLGLALKGRSAEAAPFLRRFSRLILPVVTMLAAAGVVLAVIQVQTPAALVGTAYGRLLLVKLGLLVLLFTLAGVNRWRLTASAEAGATEVQRRLARSIGAEMLIV